MVVLIIVFYFYFLFPKTVSEPTLSYYMSGNVDDDKTVVKGSPYVPLCHECILKMHFRPKPTQNYHKTSYNYNTVKEIKLFRHLDNSDSARFS